MSDRSPTGQALRRYWVRMVIHNEERRIAMFKADDVRAVFLPILEQYLADAQRWSWGVAEAERLLALLKEK